MDYNLYALQRLVPYGLRPDVQAHRWNKVKTRGLKCGK
jgi:hypothetical protein